MMMIFQELQGPYLPTMGSSCCCCVVSVVCTVLAEIQLAGEASTSSMPSMYDTTDSLKSGQECSTAKISNSFTLPYYYDGRRVCAYFRVKMIIRN